jgi:hypothetical protein
MVRAKSATSGLLIERHSPTTRAALRPQGSRDTLQCAGHVELRIQLDARKYIISIVATLSSQQGQDACPHLAKTKHAPDTRSGRYNNGKAMELTALFYERAMTPDTCTAELQRWTVDAPPN